jgi:hypothetical protein
MDRQAKLRTEVPKAYLRRNRMTLTHLTTYHVSVGNALALSLRGSSYDEERM